MKKDSIIRPTYVYQELKERQDYLAKVIDHAGKRLVGAPEGMLRTIAHGKRGNYQYYVRNLNETADGQAALEDINDDNKVLGPAHRGSCNGIYLRKSEMPRIRKLAQKKYDERILEAAQEEYAAINRLLKTCDADQILEVYENTSPGERLLIRPYMYDDVALVKKWEDVEYEGLKFSEDDPEYYSDKHERVRSKSELNIANMLAKYDIPYRYECPLVLSGGITVHPDFTILNIRTRRTLYWEHLGMMDDMDYVRKTMKKIDSYVKSDLMPGRDLIMTHEIGRIPLGTTTIEKVIKCYCC